MRKVFLVINLFICHYIFAQVGIGTTNPDASSILELSSTTQGLLMPRMNSTERAAIVLPVAGLQVFDTTTNSIWVHNGTLWVDLAIGRTLYSSDGTLTANRTITQGSSSLTFSGAGDLIKTGGNVGIGVSPPTATLEVNGSVYVNSENKSITIDAGNASRLGFVKKSGNVPVIAAASGVPIQFGNLSTGIIKGNETAAFTESMRIGSNGRVGIGTNNPSAQLHTTSAVRFETLTVAGYVTTDANGNLSSTAGLPASTSLTNNRIFVGNASNVSAEVDMSGDITIINTGATTIGVDRVTNTKIATNAVTTLKIANDAVTNLKLATDAVTTVKIAADAITSAKILTSTIDNTDLANGVGGLYKGSGTTPASAVVVSIPTSGTVAFTPSGTQVANQFSVDGTTFSVDAINNRIGIGTASPTQRLDINNGNILIGASANPMINFRSTANADGSGGFIEFNESFVNHGYAIRHNTNSGAYGTDGLWFERKNSDVYTPVFGFDISGNFGIGTTLPTQAISLGGEVARTINMLRRTTADTAGNNLTIQSGGATISATDKNGGNLVLTSGISTGTGSSTITFQTATAGVSGTGNNNPSTKMTILGNGRVGIGTGAPDQLLSVNGDASKIGGGAWLTFSDARVKKNIINYTKGLNEILSIRPVSFQYNDKSKYTDQSSIFVGVIAQEIEKVLPGTVTQIKTENFSDLRQYDSSELTYTLINAIKELNAKVERLENEIKTLRK